MKNPPIPPDVASPCELAARLLACRAEEILSARFTSEGGLSVIAPSGRKRVFSPAELITAGALRRTGKGRRKA